MPEPASTTIPLDQFTNEARSLIAAAQALADEQKHADVATKHAEEALTHLEAGAK